jgi:acetyl/propionyl-CoA carboxylase alpha subunit
MFTKILIANRSEIASRIIRTCRAMGIGTVAVFTAHDSDAAFVHEADVAVGLEGDSGYLDAEAIIEAARITGAEAIHPGYGFLSENADFARAVADAGMVFIGPDPETIKVMGSKFEAIQMMRAAGVPVAPAAPIVHHEDPVETAHRIGYPLLLKAAHGGGGRGMRILESSTGLFDEISAAGREADSAFGIEDLYVERFIPDARHIEVQVLGDTHGTVVHLYERECSVQRRFQKVIEEAPAPLLDATVRGQLLEAAVTAATAVGYVGAGTVEFLVGVDGRFTFMEMNTRLQVEHPITEAITGLDLVRFQIEIAAGVRIPTQDEIPAPVGHAIEARLYAERPEAGFTPSTGTICHFDVPGAVRVDTAIVNGTTVSHHYDPMIAKVIGHAPTRDEAVWLLTRSLEGTVVHGIDTNREMLISILREPQFVAGAVDTGWLERTGIGLAGPDPGVARLHAAVAALARAAWNRDHAAVLGFAPSGWRNVRSCGQSVSFGWANDVLKVDYDLSGSIPRVSVDGVPIDITSVYVVHPDRVDIAVGRLRRSYAIENDSGRIFVDSSAGSSLFTPLPRFSPHGSEAPDESLLAPTPGKVVSILVNVGDSVTRGEPLIVIEAMKMEQTISAPDGGVVVSISHEVGAQVEAGDVLVEIAEGGDD